MDHVYCYVVVISKDHDDKIQPMGTQQGAVQTTPGFISLPVLICQVRGNKYLVSPTSTG